MVTIEIQNFKREEDCNFCNNRSSTMAVIGSTNENKRLRVQICPDCLGEIKGQIWLLELWQL